MARTLTRLALGLDAARRPHLQQTLLTVAEIQEQDDKTSDDAV